jgi:YafQ family addiction module toxin component
MHKFSVEENLRKILHKLSKKDPSMFKDLLEKMNEILNCEEVNHYKNLRKPLQHLKRVHIKGPFILTFRYIESEDKVLFYDFGHHDRIYLE